MIKLNAKFHATNFKELNNKFGKMYKKFSPNTKSIPIVKYFDEGIGLAGSLKRLANDKIISNQNDFQGIYVFLKNSKPFYVGISQHVIERINQHVKGNDHFSSSLCYRIGADYYSKVNGKAHDGGRAGLPFGEYGKLAKKELMKCKVAFFEITEFLELYLFEVFLAMKLGTLNYNLFKTH